MKTLTLHLKKHWFEQIKSGAKTEEYRRRIDYWTTRLEGRTYDRVVICQGYPSKSDTAHRLQFHWNGYQKKTIEHPEWHHEPTEVYAIRLNRPVTLPADPDEIEMTLLHDINGVIPWKKGMKVYARTTCGLFYSIRPHHSQHPTLRDIPASYLTPTNQDLKSQIS